MAGRQLQHQLYERGLNSIARGVGRMTDFVMEKGKGSWLWTVEGKKYLDFTTGIGVVNLGHCHPRVIAAATEQMNKLVHGQVNIGFHRSQIELTEKLDTIVPEGLRRYFFTNSGAEAVENSLKLARHSTGKSNIIVFQGGYHGRTFGTMSITTSKTIYRAGFGAHTAGAFVAPYPYCIRCPAARALSQHGIDCNPGKDYCCNHPIEALELMLKQQTAPSETAAVLIEPILGEGGYVVPPPDFLPQLRKLCDKYGLLLIFDEVQSGFGRTGTMFACESFNVTPDILVFAKGIANGFPLSGLAGRPELFDKQPPGSMGGTYSGNAVACAAASAVVEVFKEERVLDNVAKRSAQLFSALRAMQAQHPEFKIKDIRGRGLMVGMEFDAPAGTASAVSKACFEEGMLVLTTSVFETLRFIPPLTISQEDMETGLAILKTALHTVFPK